MGKLNLEVAKKLIEGAEQEAKRLGIQMVISVLDEGGNLIAVHRMDDAWLASVEIAQNKAWTSVALKMPTANLAEATVPNAECTWFCQVDSTEVSLNFCLIHCLTKYLSSYHIHHPCQAFGFVVVNKVANREK